MTNVFKCRLFWNSNDFVENHYIVSQSNYVIGIYQSEKELPHYDNFYDLDGVVLPSFVNGHTHLELTDFTLKSFKSNNLWDWIIETVRYKKTLTYDAFQKNILSGEEQLLKSGTAIVGDVRSVLPEKIVLSELEGTIFFEVLGYNNEIFDNKISLLNSFIDANEIQKQVSIGISIHSFYTTPFSKAKKLLHFARAKNLPVMIHIGETIFENELFFEGKEEGFKKIFPNSNFEKENIISYADIIDLLDIQDDCLLVHCVYFTDKDWEKVAKKSIPVVLCPKSNLFWNSSLPNFNAIFNKNIKWLLGTDSFLTNSNMDVLKEAQFLYQHLSFKSGKAILNALTYNGREIFPEHKVGVHKKDRLSFVFFPTTIKKDNAIDYILAERHKPLIYNKEINNEFFEIFKK